MSEPWVLFKFRRIDKNLLGALIKRELYFASPEKLNDPFDCKVNINKAFNNAIAQSVGTNKENLLGINKIATLFDKIERDILRIGVCSFSLELENSILWSHYADGHRGICLTYQFPESFIDYNSNKILGIDKVEYGSNPLTDWFKNLDNVSGNDLGPELIKKILTIKDECWSHEKEIRIIREIVGNLEIDRDFLCQVCFGLNSSKDDITLIKRLINNCGYKVNYCQIIRIESNFGIKAIEI
jgi:hypothetical protein